MKNNCIANLCNNVVDHAHMQLQTTLLGEFFHTNETLELWIFVAFVLYVVIYGCGVFVFSVAHFATK